MTNILHTADLHLNALARDAYRHDWQVELRAMVKKHKVHTVVINGDITDAKDLHPAILVNKVADHVHELSKLAEVFINKGNHDYTAIEELPFFAFLRHINNVYWINEPQALAVGGSRVLFLPHSPNPTRDWAKVDLKSPDWIFAHNTFDGTRGDSGRILTGAPVSIFPKGARVVAGDVHTPQTNGPVTYSGAPYIVDFGDDYDPRVLLIKDNKLVSIPCTGPQKRLIDIKAGGKLPNNINKGDIVKVRVELDIGQYATWQATKDKVLDWGAKHGLVVNLVQPVAQQQLAGAKKEAKRAAPKTDAELLKAFAKDGGVDERTIKIGLNLINKV